MNRTQYEALHGTQVKEPCVMCKADSTRKSQIRRIRVKNNKAFRLAKSAAIESGKVIQLFECDEFTGWHYNVRTNAMTGKGGE